MNETQQIDAYIHNQLQPADKLLVEARLLLDDELKEKMRWQRQTYALVKMHGRRLLKQEIEAAHAKLFTEKRFETFRNRIFAIFK